MYESGENYLKTIWVLKGRNGQVRSIDIAKELDFSKPSVSRAVKLLKSDGLIEVDESGYIEFTSVGYEKAKVIYERYQILKEFIQKIAHVPELVAENEACRMEHFLSNETVQGIINYIHEKELT